MFGAKKEAVKTGKKWGGAEEMSVDKLKPTGYNPNQMSDQQFNHLVQDIEKYGFDEPLSVALDPKDGRYWIVSGEHRFRACRILGIKDVPVIIRKMTTEEQKIFTVRRNLNRGQLDSAKFTRLVKDVTDNHGIPQEKLTTLMGFENEAAFKKHLKIEKTVDPEARARVEESQKEATAVENLSFILNEIFSQHGDTIPQGFMFFMRGKKMHLMLQMTPQLEKKVEAMVDKLKRDNAQINDFLTKAIGKKVGDG